MVVMKMQNNIEETIRFGISVDEARKQLGCKITRMV